VTFAQGLVGQYVEDHSGHGQGLWARQIYGSTGSMSLPVDRSGGGINLVIDGRGQVASAGLLDLVPDFRLDAVTASLFGAERLTEYQFGFAETDRKLLAIEYADFAGAIRGEHAPEVGAEQGARSVAVAYALLESGAAGRPVTIAEVLVEEINSYQQSIDAVLEGV
jgi:predicted dehydrogenase